MMKKAEIKAMLKACETTQWQFAQFIGIGETTLSRWLRTQNSIDNHAEQLETALKRLERKW